jgi:signal transduction histidine kinase
MLGRAMAGATVPPKDFRLPLYVLIGLAGGATFVTFDILSERRIGQGTLTGPLAHAHTFVDHVLPIAVGGLLGVGAHYLRLRTRLSAAEEGAARADALRARLQKIERDQAVWVLAAAVLHELNNPLHALGLLLDELGRAQHDPKDTTDLVTRAHAQVSRALGRLATLRSFGRDEDPQFEVVALDRVLATLTEDVQALAEESGVVVRLECVSPVRARADPTYVRTIVENLVDNCLHALKGRAHGSVTIALSSEPGLAVVRVTDDGPPIDPPTRTALFEPLRSTRRQGLGLGLPIARALARAMRGDLSLEEADNKTFRLVLPEGAGP